MCGRYKLTVPYREIVRLYNLTNSVNLRARYNVVQTQDVLTVIDDAETMERRGEMMRWGLVPFWARIPRSVTASSTDWLGQRVQMSGG